MITVWLCLGKKTAQLGFENIVVWVQITELLLELELQTYLHNVYDTSHTLLNHPTLVS